MKKRLKVLVTSVGSNTSICVIKGLRRQTDFDVFIVGTDINSREDIAGASLSDSFYQVPPASDTVNYMDALKKIIKLEAVDILIPIHDAELEVISKNRQLIEKMTFLLVSPKETIEVCNDKVKTYTFFQEKKIPTLKTYAPKSESTAEIRKSGLAYPFIAKPRRGVGSKDVYEISDKKDYSALVRKINQPIIQQKATGAEYTIDVFCYNEILISAVPRRRIETRAGISYKGETVLDQELIQFAAVITKELKIVGPANIQCFKSKNGVAFTEINPRFSGGVILTVAAGINTPLFALKMSVGEKIVPIQGFEIKRMCRYLDEVFYPSDSINQAELELKTKVAKEQSIAQQEAQKPKEILPVVPQ